MYAAAKQKQLLDFALYIPVLSRLQTGAELFAGFFQILYMSPQEKCSSLPQSSCLIFLECCSYDKTTTSMTPCIHPQILLSADPLTWLSDSLLI